MNVSKLFAAAALATLPLLRGYAQGTAPAAVATMNLPPNVAEVVKLTQSGVGDDVVVAYVKNAQTPYNLSANDIITLKNYGVSSGVISAMLNRDQALRSQTVLPGNAPGATPATSVSTSPASGIPNAPTAPMAPTVGAPVAPTVGAPTAPVPPAPAPPTTSTIIEQAPPAPQVEVVPISPGPNYYWVPGYWSWNGGWVWVGGHWAARPWTGAVWVGGGWARHGRGYIWIGGHWR